MYRAKRETAPFYFYEIGTDEGDHSRLALVGELRRALDEHELVLHYQPKAVLADGEVRSVEALVRWAHPTRGMIYPGRLHPGGAGDGPDQAAHAVLLDEALRQCRAWRDDGLEISVSVNLSTRNLLDLELPARSRNCSPGGRWCPASPAGADRVRDARQSDADDRRARQLSALGVRLAIDDFGTGYSSLAYLRHLPSTDQDRPLVRHRHGRGRGDLAIVRCTSISATTSASTSWPRASRRRGLGAAPRARLQLGSGLLLRPACPPRS